MKYKFNRDTYNKLKKMDRREMELFIENLYKIAYADGQESVQDQTEKLAKVLNNTKGVGVKTYDAIMAKWQEVEKCKK